MWKKKTQSKNKENLSYEENVCHSYACAIQSCLKRMNYDEKKCGEEIEKWKECLERVRRDKLHTRDDG